MSDPFAIIASKLNGLELVLFVAWFMEKRSNGKLIGEIFKANANTNKLTSLLDKLVKGLNGGNA